MLTTIKYTHKSHLKLLFHKTKITKKGVLSLLNSNLLFVYFKTKHSTCKLNLFKYSKF